MLDAGKTKEQLIHELAMARQRNAELEASENQCQQIVLALQEDRDQFLGLLNTLQAYIVIKDTESRFVFANESTWSQLGVTTMEEVIGRTDLDFHPPELAEKYFMDEQAIFNSGEDRIDFEETYIHQATGKQGWSLSTKMLQRDSNGKIKGIIAVNRDITLLKQAQQFEAEQRLLAETMRDIATAINSILDFDNVLKYILTHVKRVAPHDTANIMLIESDVAHIVRGLGYDKFNIEENYLKESVFFNVATVTHYKLMVENGLPRIISDVRNYSEWRGGEASGWIRSHISIPIHRGEEIIGFLNLDSATPNFFTQDHIPPLQAFAQQVSIAIQNAQLFQQAQDEIARRKHIESQLIEERNLSQTIINHLPYDIYVKDLDSRFTLVNKHLVERYDDMGISKSQILGQTDLDIFQQHNISTLGNAREFYEQEQSIMRTGHSMINSEFRYDNPPYATTWALQTKVVLHNQHGEVSGIVGINYDITEHKRIESELIEERNLLRTIMNHLPYDIYVKDLDSRFTLINKHLEERYDHVGISKSQILGQTDFDIFPLQGFPSLKSAEGFYEEEQSIMQTGYHMINLEIPPYANMQGQTIWTQQTKVPLHNQHGEVTGIVGINYDITNLKQTEQNLVEREQHYRALFEGIGDAITVFDAEANILDVNETACRRLGYTREELLTMKTTDIDTSDFGKGFQDRLKVQQAKGKMSGVIGTHIAKNGRRIDIEVNITTIDFKGQPAILAVNRDITDRKQSEARYRGLFEYTPISIWEEDFSEVKIYIDTLRASGISDFHAYFEEHPEDIKKCAAMIEILNINKATLDMFKIGSKEEFFKKRGNLSENFTDEKLLSIRNQLIAVANSETEFEQEIVSRARTKDEKHIAMRWRVTPGYGDSLSRVLISMLDITERKQAQSVLAKERTLLRTILDTALDFIYVKDTEGRFIVTNTAHLTSLGKSSEEVIGKLNGEVYPPKAAEQFNNDEQAIIQSGQPSIDKDETRLNQVGQPIWLRTTKVALRDDVGTVIGILGITRDITLRQQIEDQLRESEVRFRTLVHTLPVLMTIKDTNSQFLYASPKTLHFFGLSSLDQLIGKSDYDFQPQEYAKKSFDDEQEIIQFGQPRIEYEEPHTDPKTGELRWSLSTKVPLRNSHVQHEDGEIIGIVTISSDITERKQSEEKLREAKVAADIANQAKTIFLANMSHELRTPLNAILGFSQLLTYEEQLDPTHHQYITSIEKSGQHLLRIINEILEISRIEAGRLELNLVDFDLYGLLEDLKSLFAIQARAKNLQLTFEGIHDAPQFLNSDAGKLQQILTNLLRNAIKFTDYGDITLRVRVDDKKISDSTQVHLHFEVQDTGIGLNPDEVDLLFEPFWQSSTHQMQQGTGLGLAIVKQFVQYMHGEIDVQSGINEGTIFTFSIPMTIIPSSIIPALNTSKVIGTTGNHPAYRILIVDDEMDNRLVLKDLIQDFGFEIQEASNGQEAYDIWENWHPDLIWMDLQMPIMDGYETTRRIKADPRGKATTIIVLTATAFKQDQKVIIETGCDDFLIKPVQHVEIFQIMQKYLDITFIYQENTQTSVDQIEDYTSLTDLALQSQIPSHLIHDLKSAATILDIQSLHTIIKELEHYDPQIAKVLIVWVTSFRIDKILEFIEALEQP